MVDKIEETVLDIKTPGLNKLETYVLSNNRYNTYWVLSFSDLNKAQIFQKPYRDSSRAKIEKVMSFEYSNLFKPNEDTEDYYIRKPDEENFNGFKGFNDIKFPYAYREENFYFMLHRKYIPIQEYEISTLKNDYENLYKEDYKLKCDNIIDEKEGNVDYGNDFLVCEIVHAID